MLRARAAILGVTVRTWALTGVALGTALGVVTAADNGLRDPRDVLRVHAALAATFGAVLAAAGGAAGLVAALLGRPRGAAAPIAFAHAVACTAFLWGLRAFEFEWAYPARWPLVRDAAGMLLLATAAVVVAAAGAAAAGAAVLAVARRAPGVTWLRAAGGMAAVALASSALAAIRPAPERAAAEQDRAERAGAGPAAGAPSGGVAPAPAAPSVRPRLLVVGCDGADPDVLDALLAEGVLPNLGDLVARGAYLRLRTIANHPSPALWTSIASSRTPEDTGIRDFYVQRVLGARTPVASFPMHFGLNDGLLLRDVLGPRAIRVTPVNGDMVGVRRLWSVLAERGVSAGVVNWLVTWPARTEGAEFVVSDRAWAEARLARDAGTPEGDVAARGLWDPPEAGVRLPATEAAWASEDAFAAAAACSLVAAYAPAVLFAYFRDVDAAEHLHWDAWEPRFTIGADGPPRAGPVRDAYTAFDRHLGALRGAMGEDANVIVLSDHGHRAWFTWLGRGTPGGHTDAPDGVLLAAGPDIRPSPSPSPPGARGNAGAGEQAHVYDLAPTVLHLAGLPAAADMEGRVLTEILAGPPPLPRVATYETGAREEGDPVATEADAAMIERLRALGYIR